MVIYGSLVRICFDLSLVYFIFYANQSLIIEKRRFQFLEYYIMNFDRKIKILQI